MEAHYQEALRQKLATRGKQKISVALYEGLKAQILDGSLAINERINEKLLAKALDVSRTPLRQALDLLAKEHLLAYEENRGVRVININEETIEEIFAIQYQLEELLYHEAMRKLTGEQLCCLAQRFQRLKAYETAQRFDLLQELIEHFKQVMMSLARTPILELMLQELKQYSDRLSALGRLDARQQQVTLRSQIHILHSLIRKDQQQLTATLQQQNLSARHQALQAYRAGDSGLGGEADLGDESADSLFACREVNCPLYSAFQVLLVKPIGETVS